MDRILEFTGNNTMLVLMLMISFFVLVFSELRRKAGGLVTVDPTAAVRLINNDGVVLDLRNKEAFSRGHIVNAKNIPFDELDAHKSRIDQFKNKTRDVKAKRIYVSACDTCCARLKHRILI